MATSKNKATDYEALHLQHLARYKRQINAIFNTAAEEAAKIGARIDEVSPDHIFSFDDYPGTKAKVNALIKKMGSDIAVTITSGVGKEWELANTKNDLLTDRTLGKAKDKLGEEQRERLYNPNDQAREAFQKRKVNGLNLSERVWKYATQFKSEIEMGLDLGISRGKAAPALARELKRYLQEPDKLFRRIRDKHGNLKLSRRAAAYHPGRGVYRSSYKNAERLAVTETNIAYRTADYERWQKLDFVVGIEIKLSNNHTCLGRDGRPHPFHDICDELAGRYPKTFKFTGWHPYCRCHAESINKTPDEVIADARRMMNGEDALPPDQSKNCVRDMPKAFKQWMQDNADRVKAASERGKLPYFLEDNKVLAGIEKAKATTTMQEKADKRHETRTAEQIKEIKEKWKQRRASEYNSKVQELEKATGVSFADTSALILRYTDLFKAIGQGASAAQTEALLARLEQGMKALQAWGKRGRKANGTQKVRHETLEMLKARLGDKLPETLPNLDKAIAKYEKTDDYGELAKRHKAAIEKLMRNVFDKHDLGMNIEDYYLEDVLSTWFKNTFEVGRSGGWQPKHDDINAPISESHERLKNAHRLFGLGKNVAKEQLERSAYEKYGSLLDHDILTSIQSKYAAKSYGNVEVRFKKDKVIATWSAGDTLGTNYQPSLVSDPKSCSFDDMSRTPTDARESFQDLGKFRDNHAWGYFEIQYHGKLTADCVESLTYPYDLRRSEHAKSLEVAKKWKDSGAKVFYVSDGELKSL